MRRAEAGRGWGIGFQCSGGAPRQPRPGASAGHGLPALIELGDLAAWPPRGGPWTGRVASGVAHAAGSASSSSMARSAASAASISASRPAAPVAPAWPWAGCVSWRPSALSAVGLAGRPHRPWPWPWRARAPWRAPRAPAGTRASRRRSCAASWSSSATVRVPMASSSARSWETSSSEPANSLQRLLERLAALEVEVVGRLVEDQDVGPGMDEDRQRQPPALAAREPVERLLGVLAGEQEAPEQRPRLGRASARWPAAWPPAPSAPCRRRAPRRAGRGSRA